MRVLFLLDVLFKMSTISSHTIAVSSNEEEESIVISLNKSDDLPSVKYTCWVGIFTVSVPLRKADKRYSVNIPW